MRPTVFCYAQTIELRIHPFFTPLSGPEPAETQRRLLERRIDPVKPLVNAFDSKRNS